MTPFLPVGIFLGECYCMLKDYLQLNLKNFARPLKAIKLRGTDLEQCADAVHAENRSALQCITIDLHQDSTF